MAIDIFNIQPSVVDRSLSGKTILLAGAPKNFGLPISNDWNGEQ